MTLNEFYQRANQQGIDVDYFPMWEIVSFPLLVYGKGHELLSGIKKAAPGAGTPGAAGRIHSMNNEEKILNVLEQVVSRLDKVDSRLDKVDSRLDKMEEDIATVKEDIEVIKEDAAVTRSATNTLLDWAEKAEVQIRIPLYNKAE